MRRVLAFAILLAVFAVWRFPHHRVVEHLLARRLQGLPVHVDVGSVAPSLWPLGYRLGDVVVTAPEVRAALRAVSFGLLPGSGFDAVACGGTVDGGVDRSGAGGVLRLSFDGIDPASCLQVGSLEISGTFDGSLVLEGLGAGPRASVLGGAARAGVLAVEGTAGRVAGHLPARPQRNPEHALDGARERTAVGRESPTQEPSGTPLGTWDFTRASLRARLDGGEVQVEKLSAEAEGVHWEVAGATLAPGTNGRTRVSAELRARRIDDSPRAKAVLGLLPRAGEGPDGWRRYRITGTLDAPKVVGLR